jgi:hypothetical protein
MSERDAAVEYLHLLILKHTPSHHINLYYHVPLILKSGTPPFFAPFGPIFYSFIARYFGMAFSFLIWVLMHARRFTDSTLYDMASEWFGHFFCLLHHVFVSSLGKASTEQRHLLLLILRLLVP